VLRPGPEAAAGERERDAPRPARPRAEASGVATVTALLTGRARALGSVGGTTARRTDEARTAPTEANRVATREPGETPSPSFQRARREFEHRHHDTAAAPPPPRE
jgi:hypothetical protein